MGCDFPELLPSVCTHLRFSSEVLHVLEGVHSHQHRPDVGVDKVLLVAVAEDIQHALFRDVRWLKHRKVSQGGLVETNLLVVCGRHSATGGCVWWGEEVRGCGLDIHNMVVGSCSSWVWVW